MSSILGVDISGWQHPNNAPIDWEKVAEAGYDFMIVKATQGTNFENAWLHRDLSDARAAGLLLGAYHYFDIGIDAVAQAQAFVGSLVGELLELGCWLDWEPSDVADYAVSAPYTAFLDKVAEARGICGTYCDNDWYTRLRTLSLPLHRHWEAWPSTTEPSPPPFMWQYGTSTVPGIVGAVDVDRLFAVRGIDPCTAPPARSVPTKLDTRSDEERVSEASPPDVTADAAQ